MANRRRTHAWSCGLVSLAPVSLVIRVIMVTLVAVLALGAAPCALAQGGEGRGGFPIPSILRSIHGEVISKATGLPVAGVRVRLSGNGLSMVDTTDEGGQFRFDGLPPGSYWVMASGGAPTVVTVAGFDAFVTLTVD